MSVDKNRSALPPAGDSPTIPAAARLRTRDVVVGPLAFGRETIESIVVAFTLALLFRAFEAEAFVIPTGSMAPALMGRHKDLVCSACGRDYRVGCSAEEDDQSQSFRGQLAQLEGDLVRARGVMADQGAPAGEREQARRRVESLESPHGQLEQVRMRLASKLIGSSRCPNCGHVMDLLTDSHKEYDPRYPSFNGDRILVNKFAYDYVAPKRFDVVVFRYPEDAKTNYIKRLIGLPGETVSIAGGDIWTSRDAAEPTIARKPTAKLRAMLQCVHDSRHESAELAQAGWPSRWADWAAPGTAPGWSSADGGRSWAVRAAGSAAATLRYRHFMPTSDDWEELGAGGRVDGELSPLLIDDFQPYNAMATRSHWVGDLAVEARLENQGDAGTVTLDLVEAGRRHEARIDLSTGAVELASPGLGGPLPKAATKLRGRGTWTVLFANVDDELSLFVDGRRIVFDQPTTWAAPIGSAEAAKPVRDEPRPGVDTATDLAPAGVTASGATIGLSGVRVLRDIFYIGADGISAVGGMIEKPRLDFPLEADQFFVLGDNSAASKDSRLWLEGHHVDRNLIVGKALTIFWPHAWYPSWAVPVRFRVRGNPIELRLPSWPNFGRMGPVR
ncbi:MAG: signal peptidase I [Planctomycetaceae bacterium]|nr:signal peptidase I [Planctomycetaceae bacterium]